MSRGVTIGFRHRDVEPPYVAYAKADGIEVEHQADTADEAVEGAKKKLAEARGSAP